MATALSDVARYGIIRRQRIAETAPVRVACARCGFSTASPDVTVARRRFAEHVCVPGGSVKPS